MYWWLSVVVTTLFALYQCVLVVICCTVKSISVLYYCISVLYQCVLEIFCCTVNSISFISVCIGGNLLPTGLACVLH